jgi:hypothetical protein
MIAQLQRLRCRLFHHHISRPMHGHYVCFDCLLEWPVDWPVRELARLEPEAKPKVEKPETVVASRLSTNVIAMPRQRQRRPPQQIA